MNNNFTWKERQSVLDHANKQGEGIAQAFGNKNIPIDPLKIIKEEPSIYAEGDDFQDALDGRLTYVGKGRFCLVYNTKYNRNQFDRGNALHPKIRFTIAHELGHFYIQKHREYLQKGGQAYSCITESYPEAIMELAADAFAAGLLMPSELLAPFINHIPEPTLDHIKQAATNFQVSMTSMMIRWVRLSDFPCGVFSVVRHNIGFTIQWGWVSGSFVDIGTFGKQSGSLRSHDTLKFLESVACFDNYNDGNGLGYLSDWIKTDRDISVAEFYAIIPYANHMLVFIAAPEDEIEYR